MCAYESSSMKMTLTSGLSRRHRLASVDETAMAEFHDAWMMCCAVRGRMPRQSIVSIAAVRQLDVVTVTTSSDDGDGSTSIF